MDTVIVSPHLDDAVLSCGDYIAASKPDERITILTVFAGIPIQELPLTVYDSKCGFDSPKQAMGERVDENKRACLVLDCRHVNLPFFDRQYGIENNDIDHALAKAMSRADRLLIPAGIRHPDHEYVAELSLNLLKEQEVFMYEEIPYRVHEPDLVYAPFKRVRDMGLTPDLMTSPERSQLKRAAVACYRSQAWSMDLDSCFVPERIHKLWRGRNTT